MAKANQPKKPTLADRLTMTEAQGHQGKFAQLRAALQNTDDLGAVVRAHIVTEHELLVYISKRVSPAVIMDHIPKQYGARVDVAVALGLDVALRDPLKRLGDIRNMFAHDPAAAITKAANDKLWNAFVAGQQQWITSVGQKIPGSKKTFDQTTQRGRFNLYAASLWLWMYKVNNP